MASDSGDNAFMEPVTTLIKDVQLLASEDRVSRIQNLVTHVANLEQEAKRQAEEVKDLTAIYKEQQVNHERAVEEIKKEYEAHRQQLLEGFREDSVKVSSEKISLEAEVSRLQGSVAEAEKTIEDLSKREIDLKNKNEDHVKRQKNYLERSIEQQKRIEQLEIQLTQQTSEIDKFKDKIKQQQFDVSAANASRDRAKIEATSAGGRTLRAEERCKQIRGFAQNLLDDKREEISQHLQWLWESCLNVFVSCLDEDLPQDVLTDPNAWDELTKGLQEPDSRVPVPRSNSPCAKYMRIAVSLTILATALNDHIFTTTYLFKDDSEVRTVSLNLADENPDKERFCRGLLLSLENDTQNKNAKHRISLVINKVMGSVQPLLRGSRADDFRAALNTTVQAAADLWRSVQGKKSRFEADTDRGDQWEWQRFLTPATDDHTVGASQHQETEAVEDRMVLCVFPRIFAVDPEDDVPIFPGMAVMASQTTEAARELSATRAASPVLERNASNRTHQRRASATPRNIASKNGVQNGSFLGSGSSSTK